jgi:hypothetical protein
MNWFNILPGFQKSAAGMEWLLWTLVLTLAIGCAIVMLMKGPAYVADAYDMNDSDQPA